MPDESRHELLTNNRKALTINLDNSKYGTFAEIGAGQETARAFFQAGGAAGTVAKTMSAYDMTFSDEIYGRSGRYVSRERLLTMLDHEFGLLVERLDKKEGDEKLFFAFANTVKARSYRGSDDEHGWLGIRFQLTLHSKPNEIIVHTRMWDESNVEQQHAIGILGVNLIYGALYLTNDLDSFVKSLVDNVGSERIEIDLIHIEGPDFEQVDNRLLNLQLVREGLTNAVLFDPSGHVVQPSNALYKKAILVQRGSFRPVTKVNVDMLNCAGAQFIQEPAVKDKSVIILMEITMSNLLASGDFDNRDFIERIETLNATGNYVLISNYFEFYRLTSYFRRYTKEMIGVVLGINNLLEVFNDKYYTHLAGGILENFGRLFRNSVRLYIYPMKQRAFRHYLELQSSEGNEASVPKGVETAGGFADEMLITCDNLRVDDHLTHLYKHLLENGYIQQIKNADLSLLEIFSRDILRLISENNPEWETKVPEDVAAFIKSNHLFGYDDANQKTTA